MQHQEQMGLPSIQQLQQFQMYSMQNNHSHLPTEGRFTTSAKSTHEQDGDHTATSSNVDTANAAAVATAAAAAAAAAANAAPYGSDANTVLGLGGAEYKQVHGLLEANEFKQDSNASNMMMFNNTFGMLGQPQLPQQQQQQQQPASMAFHADSAPQYFYNGQNNIVTPAQLMLPPIFETHVADGYAPSSVHAMPPMPLIQYPFGDIIDNSNSSVNSNADAYSNSMAHGYEPSFIPNFSFTPEKTLMSPTRSSASKILPRRRYSSEVITPSRSVDSDLSFLLSSAQRSRSGGSSTSMFSDDSNDLGGLSSRRSSGSMFETPSKSSKKVLWTDDETKVLFYGITTYGVGNWKAILSDPEIASRLHPSRTEVSLKDRYRIVWGSRSMTKQGRMVQKARRKRNKWTAEEDREMLRLFDVFGPQWTTITRNSPVLQARNRTGTDVRDRIRNKYPELYSSAGTVPLARRRSSSSSSVISSTSSITDSE